MIFFDTETCGLHGMPVLIQYAEDDGEIHLHSIWTTPARQTLELIERFVNSDGVVGFNLAFDWFMICKAYTVLSLLPDTDVEPIDMIDEIAEFEPLGRDGPCVKPKSAFDIMLHARKGPYQSTMDRGDIRIRRVPTALAWQLAKELEKRIELSDIYFARRKDKTATKWQVFDITDEDGDINPNFKDVVLKFHPSSALKALAVDALKLPVDSVLLFTDIEIDKVHYPEEYGYAPFAKAIGNRHSWNGAWPEKIIHHINHWSYHQLAREYAKKDVEYTRALYKFFGSPTLGDNDSILSCMVAAVRWKGYKCNIEGLKALKTKTLASKSKILPNGEEFVIPTAPAKAKIYINQVLSAEEQLLAGDSTKKILLEEYAKLTIDCKLCEGRGTILPKGKLVCGGIADLCKCVNCNGTGAVPHPVAERATEILQARQANYEADLYDKFILAGRFHASFVVIGALSSRMAGTDGLNAQGVKKTKEVRGNFPLAFADFVLCGGDFSGFEVTLAEACYKDPDLRKDLQSGKKIHALFGVHVYPDMTYEQILATEGTKDDKYTRCKQAVFTMFYGGEGFTLKSRLGVDLETADKAYAAFCKKYRQVGIARQKISNMFCSMRQPGGLGTKVVWHEPADYIESMFGFRRYFTLENTICKALFDLANSPPREWNALTSGSKVVRRDRTQSASGAVQSALYGAAFGLQSANMRAAANHVIQSSGAEITKEVQCKIWTVQPSGINPWLVQPMNIHDEIMCPTKPEVVDRVAEIVNECVESFRPKVPLIKMDWQKKLNSWADKS